MTWDEAQSACPEGSEIPPFEDLIAIYCESAGPSGGFYPSGRCSDYVSSKNEELESKLDPLDRILTKPGNAPKAPSAHDCSSDIGGYVEGSYNNCVDNNNKNDQYNVVCVGK